MGDVETLREDYEFYMTRTGEFTATYQAHCTGCGFSHEFKHRERVTQDTGKAGPR